ncbi:MAG: 2-succinyl-6-hydroxy-2,4-cyclohexadiene-1-carboxylate synthase [Microcoleaceae cyanobacterium]
MSYYSFDSCTRVYYQLTEISSSNPAILLLHGFMGNCNDFQNCIPQLYSSFSCLTVDLPGHGKTQILGDESYYTISKTATILICLLKDLNISKVYLFGYSMGGRLALYLMIHYPQYFERVILESASPGLRTDQERSQRFKVDINRAKQLESQDFKQFLINWYNQPLFHTLKSHSKFNEVLSRRLQNNPDELAKSLRNMGTGIQPSLWKNLSKNKILLLLIVGQYDDKFIQINQQMAALSQQTTLKIIPNCGHNIHLENQEKWVNTILYFLATT